MSTNRPTIGYSENIGSARISQTRHIRVCCNLCYMYVAGMKFGLMVAKGTMSALIRRFTFLPGTTPLSLDYMIALRSETGMTLKLESRSG